jgi:acetyl-CoA acetyltransferase family protein
MTRVPMFSNMGDAKPSKKLTEQYEIINQGLSAERIAEKWNLSREQLDAFSVQSHERAFKAIAEGRFEKEIVPIEVTNEDGSTELFAIDEGPRAGTTLETLGGLKTVFDENGRITAGNASQMSDGASAVLLMSLEKAQQLGLKPRARIHTRVVVGSDPTLMLTGPIAATQKVLEKANLTIEDMDVYEVNEAFAPVPLAWLKDTGADPAKLNRNGGAIALGHPLGASGTKLLVTLLHELERTNGRYGLLAICEGMGMANATIIERLPESEERS